jgi:putative ABC transport system permease protein
MRALRIGFLLGFRQIQRASLWTTLLIIFVMMFTFLNLIAVSGILVGLIVGSERAVRESSLGDVVITPKKEEKEILETPTILRELEHYPEIAAYSVRWNGGGVLEANYKERRDLSVERDIANVKVTGIDPVLEDSMTNLSRYVVDGEYLDPKEEGRILLGVYYIKEYAEQYGDIFETVDGVKPGDTVRLTVGSVSKEFIVKGIVRSKVDEVSLNTYIPEREFRRLFGRNNQNADQIVMRVVRPEENAHVKESLVESGLGTKRVCRSFLRTLKIPLTFSVHSSVLLALL